MSNVLPITIQMGALPPAVDWSPQQLMDASVPRMRLVTSTSFALFVTGSTEPSSNVGPWLKNGTSWYVWSDTAGGYVPQELAPESLGYWIGSDAPDNNVYNFWIKTAVGGSPLALMVFYNGAWTDVYATALGSYLTTAAFTAAIANYSTTAQMNAAIAAAIAGIPPNTPFAAYPAQAELTTGPQVITCGAAASKVTLNLAPVNPAPAPFNTTLYRYVAPAAGIYEDAVNLIVSNNTGTAAGMEIILRRYINSMDTGVFAFNGTPSPNDSQWTLSLPPLPLQLALNDYVEYFIEATDGVDVGNVHITNVDAGFKRISA